MQRSKLAMHIAAARQAKGLTQVEVAQLAGVSRSLIAKLERGTADALAGRFDSIARVCRVLRISLDDALRYGTRAL